MLKQTAIKLAVEYLCNKYKISPIENDYKLIYWDSPPSFDKKNKIVKYHFGIKHRNSIYDMESIENLDTEKIEVHECSFSELMDIGMDIIRQISD